jgi:hypothetical protein
VVRVAHAFPVGVLLLLRLHKSSPSHVGSMRAKTTASDVRGHNTGNDDIEEWAWLLVLLVHVPV